MSTQLSNLGPASHILTIDGQCAILNSLSKLNPVIGCKGYPNQTVYCYYKKLEWVVGSKDQMTIKNVLLEGISFMTIELYFCL